LKMKLLSESTFATPKGRIHFAGEHASSPPGWMQGALESGNRAAREVNQGNCAFSIFLTSRSASADVI